MVNRRGLQGCLFVALLCLLFGGDLWGADRQWREIRRNGDIVVYERVGAGTDWVSTRGTCVVDAPLARVAPYFMEVAPSRHITPHCENKTVLAATSDTDRILYSRIRIIWPFRDRYLVYRDRVVRQAPGDIRLTSEDRPDFDYEDPGRVRARIRNGRVRLASVDGGAKTAVTVEADLHAGGWLPQWLLGFAARHWTHDMFRNLKEDLAETSP